MFFPTGAGWAVNKVHQFTAALLFVWKSPGIASIMSPSAMAPVMSLRMTNLSPTAA